LILPGPSLVSPSSERESRHWAGNHKIVSLAQSKYLFFEPHVSKTTALYL
jgi:hypothetical protein